MSMHSLYIWTDKWQRIPLRYEIDLNSEPNRTQGNPTIVYMFYNRYNHFNTLNIFGSSHNLFIFSLRFHCRYNFAKQRIQERIAREGIKNKILYESTHLDPERKLKSSNNSWATLSVENPKRTTYSSGAPQMYILCSIKKSSLCVNCIYCLTCMKTFLAWEPVQYACYTLHNCHAKKHGSVKLSCVLNARNQTEGKTALQQGYPLLVLLLSEWPKGQCLKLFCSLSFNKTVFLLITMKGGVQTCITTQSMMVFTHTCITKFSVSNHPSTQPLIKENLQYLSMVKWPTYYSNKLWTDSECSYALRFNLTGL